MTGMNDLMDKRIEERQNKCLHNFDKLKDSRGYLFCSVCAKRLDE